MGAVQGMGCAPSTDARAGFAPGIRAGSPHRGQGSAGAQLGGGIAQLAALGSSSRYSSAEPVWELLFSGLIRPIRLSWFAQATSTRSRCKSLLASSPLPEAAFIPINELKEQFGGGNDAGNGDVLPLIAIASESVNPLDLREVGEMLLQHRKAFAECNFSEMGVIWAHGSFASHEAYIRTADVWFGHSGISALLIERPPAAAEQLFGYTLCAAEPISKSMQSSHTHDGAGWPTFERLAAELTQKWHAWNAPWDLVIDMAAAAAKAAPGRWGSHISKFEMHGSEWLEPAPRNWPVGPDDFALLAPSLHFDGGEPERSLAVDQYRKCVCCPAWLERRAKGRGGRGVAGKEAISRERGRQAAEATGKPHPLLTATLTGSLVLGRLSCFASGLACTAGASLSDGRPCSCAGCLVLLLNHPPSFSQDVHHYLR